MKPTIKKQTGKLLTVIAAFAMIACFIPQIATQVHASDGDPAIATRTEIVLKDTANSDNAQTIWYAGNKWRVISYDGGGNRFTNPEGLMTLFASDNMGSASFSRSTSGSGRNYYKDSYLQNAIDGMFTSMLSEEERSTVHERKLEVDEFSFDKSDWGGKYYTKGIAGTETAGNLWPLSTAEALQLPDSLKNASSDWWLRSPGSTDDCAGKVHSQSGVVYVGGETIVPNGVRPAFDLKLESVLFAAAAEQGKASGEPDANALTPIGWNSNNEWKLTVRSGHDSFKVTDCTATEKKVTLHYTGAAIGTEKKPEYISALITTRPVTDSTSRVKYYGRIKNCTSSEDASGTLTINIAGKLDINDSLYVFNEQYNGDKLTDYASALQKLSFPREGATLFAKGKTVSIKSRTSKLKKTKKISAKKAYKITKRAGVISFKKVKASKSSSKFRVNAKTGQITVRKGLKRGTYKLTVKVIDSGSIKYKPGAINVVVKIKVTK